MDSNQINQILALCGNRFPMESLELVRNKLQDMDYNVASIKMTQLKDPTLALILSVVVGSMGIDRFYIGDIGLGVGKLLTCGGAYVWWLIDIFIISEATKRKNLEMFLLY